MLKSVSRYSTSNCFFLMVKFVYKHSTLCGMLCLQLNKKLALDRKDFSTMLAKFCKSVSRCSKNSFLSHGKICLKNNRETFVSFF